MLWVAFFAKLLVGSTWGLLADEAYYWAWSRDLAWGYFDQPAGISAQIAFLGALFGDSLGAIRLGPVLFGLMAGLVTAWSCTDRLLAAVLWCTVPSLVFLTWFATPDAGLLAAWVCAVAAARAGPRWWWLVGLSAGMAANFKYTGCAVAPLLVFAAGPREWRESGPWLAIVIALLCLVPNILFNAQHDWVSVRFQLGEGLLHPDTPGISGMLTWFGDQIAVTSPIAWIAMVVWAAAVAPGVWRSWRDGDPDRRATRMAWFTCVPVLVGFVSAATVAPPEAHWPAIAVASAVFGLADWKGPRLQRLAWLGAGFAGLMTVVFSAHLVQPIWPVTQDPGARLTRGPLLADWVEAWALDPDGGRRVVWTERYQEAAWLRYYTDLDATTAPNCGRRDQFDLWPRQELETVLFVRPATSGSLTCASTSSDVRRLGELRGLDGFGRHVGDWELFEISRVP